jgi:hypothetical protein
MSDYGINDVMDELKQIKFNTIRMQFPNPQYANPSITNLRVKLIKEFTGNNLTFNNEYDVTLGKASHGMRLMSIPNPVPSSRKINLNIITSFPFHSGSAYIFEEYFEIVPSQQPESQVQVQVQGGAKKKSKKVTRKRSKTKN